MDTEHIKEIINSQEPIAIMKYFEWPIFSKDYARTQYSLLKLNKTHNHITEYDIPFNLVPFVISKIECFEKVVELNQGIIWERSGFREIVKRSITRPEIIHFISH